MSRSKFIKIIKFTSSQKIGHHCISQLDLTASLPNSTENKSLVQAIRSFCGIRAPVDKMKSLSYSKSKQTKTSNKQMASRGTRIQYHH